MPNRLAAETSPYLLQHKDNPVDWYAWGDEAFAAARELDRPVLLSVGYSACHWCHVMAHESFENAGIAALMNQRFINIKVDREERPDVDAIYMQAVQAFTGRGGWPMTVFLLPDGLPFYGGTYFPPEDRGGMPAFSRVLESIADAYATRRDELTKTGKQFLDQMATMTQLPSGDTLLSTDLLDAGAAGILGEHDTDYGGFGAAPKFPQPMNLDFLLRFHVRTGREEALAAVHRTLFAMARGGMYDQIGGGFHRYSTDAYWLVPHFEKMLYDNAQLARVYLDAYKLTHHPDYRRITEETLDYVLREMTHPLGGFYSSQDADSEGVEGKFFLWTPEEFDAVLGSDAAPIAAYLGATKGGNFIDEGVGHGDPTPKSILYIRVPADGFAKDNGIDLPAFTELLKSAKSKLFAYRDKRVHPGLDDKVLTSWNGLMLTAFAKAALALDSATYREAAVRNADFLLAAMRPEGRLLHSWKDGVAKVTAYLDDYALLAEGLLATYEATFDERYLREAVSLADEMIDLFWDDAVQGFYDTARDQQALITRPRDLFDNPSPSGTSAAVNLLLRLAVITGKEDYERRAATCLRALAPFIDRSAMFFGNLLCALDFYLAKPQELALVWPLESARPEALEGRGSDSNPSAHAEALEARPLLDVVRGEYLPHLLLVGAPAGRDSEVTPLLRDRPALDGKATAYLCERFLCQAPTADPKELRRQLERTVT